MHEESRTYHVVHFNLAFAREPLDHPLMAGFTSQVDAVNQRAAQADGFVWMSDAGENDAVILFGDPKALLNMTVWRSVDALRAFTYGGSHAAALKRRAEWFLQPNGPAYVLWWIAANERPTFAEARERLALLAANGPTASAFTFTSPFGPPL